MMDSVDGRVVDFQLRLLFAARRKPPSATMDMFWVSRFRERCSLAFSVNARLPFGLRSAMYDPDCASRRNHMVRHNLVSRRFGWS